jgi:hypothetical protein
VSSSPTSVRWPSWRQLYEAAMLELNLDVLELKVDEARQAIHTRIMELNSADVNESTELIDSLHMLDGLLKMYRDRPL